MGEKEGEGYVIKPDLNPEISSFPRLGCFDALFREGEGRDVARYTRFSHPPEKIPPSSPAQRRLEINREGMGEGKIWKLEPKPITINKRRERERKRI